MCVSLYEKKAQCWSRKPKDFDGQLQVKDISVARAPNGRYKGRMDVFRLLIVMVSNFAQRQCPISFQTQYLGRPFSVGFVQFRFWVTLEHYCLWKMAYVDIVKLKSVLTAYCASFVGFQLGLFDFTKANSNSVVILFMWYMFLEISSKCPKKKKIKQRT